MSQSPLDHHERKLISAQSIYAFDKDIGSPPDATDKETLDGLTVPEIAAKINALNQRSSTSTPEQAALQASAMRKFASRLCSLGSLEACECILRTMGISSVSTASVAKYGLTAIANCTSSEEVRMQLMKWGAGEFIVHMLKTYGDEHFSVAQYGIIAVTNLTSNAEIRNTLGSLGACQLIVKMLQLHAFKEEAQVAVYGLYAIGKLSLNHDLNRQRFGSCGGCEEVVTVLRQLGATNHTITDYGMYALAHLAYFNLENKKRLSNVETYKIIMALVRQYGKEQISIASFGLTAVSNLIHTEASKDKFGALGMCDLVQELGSCYNMQPEALANNVVFTLGKLTHKHADNSKLLTRSGVQLIVQALQSYGVDRITQAGNGLFALSALIQHNPSAWEKILTTEVVELVITMLCVHAIDDASIAIYGINILECAFTCAEDKGDTVLSFLYRTLVSLKIGTLLVHMLSVYSYNALNCNVDVTCRVVNLLHLLYVKHDRGDSASAELKEQLLSAKTATVLQSAILNNVVVMDKHANDYALEIITRLAL